MNLALLRLLVRSAEGCRLQAYQDTAGNWTIGYGHFAHDVKEGMTISQAEADALLESDLAAVLHQVPGVIGEDLWPCIDDNRQAALGDMCFTLGAGGLSKFSHMILAVRQANWYGAYQECLASKWASEAQSRAIRDARILLSGKAPELQGV